MEYLTIYKCGICGEAYDSTALAATCEERRKLTGCVRDGHVTVFDGNVKGEGALTGLSRYGLFGMIHLEFMEVKFVGGNCRFIPCHYIIPRLGE